MVENTAPFVRDQLIPEAPPPVYETGMVKWLRENLFSSPLNIFLTVVSLWAIYQVILGAAPWFINGVWSGDSVRDCYDILDGATGACFAVLKERWPQLIYGFKYPPSEFWRPNLAAILLSVAIAPVLFNAVSRKIFFFTLVYPFLAYWLVWGGTILGPLVAFAGFVFAVIVFRKLEAQGFALAILGGISTALACWISGGYLVDMDKNFLALPSVPSRNMGGFMLNFILGIVCVSLSIPLGIMLALGRQSNMPIIKWICVLFIEFIRGVPLITLLFVANVVLAYFFPPNTNIDLILRVIIMITLFSAAYIAEVIRGGLAALPTGQFEAANSLGLDYTQSMRLIILPQALKVSIPGIVNVAVGLFKDTTLVSIISMFDLIGMIRGPILASTAWSGVYWELFGFAALIFFVVCYAISQYSQWLERQLETDHRT